MNLTAEDGGTAEFVDEDAGPDVLLRLLRLRKGRIVWEERWVRQRLGLGDRPLIARIENRDVADMAVDVGVQEQAVIVDEPSS